MVLLCLGIVFILLTPVLCRFDHEYPLDRSAVKVFADATDNSAYRLPTNLKPTWYNLTLLPDLSKGTFKGMVDIKFDVITPASAIVMHVNTNYISNVVVTSLTTSDPAVTAGAVNVSDTVHEFLQIPLSKEALVQQGALINLTYDGLLATDMLGFYLSTYTESGTTHTMAITQFESTYARRAFPCFDEPGFRATFVINIGREASMKTLSNMPPDPDVPSYVDPISQLTMDVYQVTPRMPTYLVAFSVNNLDVKSASDIFKVYARHAAIEDATYIASVGQKILDTESSFVSVPYRMPKMEVVAVPDFNIGAMENWGLTTFRERYVLFNSTINSLKDKFSTLSLVTHEFGHQWFGDLVTPEWWDYAWLNEAFATYFEYTSPNKVEPTWGIGNNMFVIWATQYALDADTGNPRPMTSPVFTPQQIDNIFDYVIYEKGGSVLRMTENFLTTDVWKKGLNAYLTTEGASDLGTGTPTKLFKHLQDATTSLSNVEKTLTDWTTQPGYPVIKVTRNTSDPTAITFDLMQSPYALRNTSAKFAWNVPITCTGQSMPNFDASSAKVHWLLPDQADTATLHLNESGWVVCNLEQVGFYRVNYDTGSWDLLINQLKTNHSVIGDINRGQLIDDCFHFAITGHLNYTTVFGITSYLSKETALVPWFSFFSNMRYLLNQFSGTTTGDGLKLYSRNTMLQPFQFLINNYPTLNTTFLGQTTILYAMKFACDVNLHECETFSMNLFNTWRHDKTAVPAPELLESTLCTGLSLDTSLEAFLDVWNLYLNSDNGAQKVIVLYAMGCTVNETAIDKYLDAVTDTTANLVRLQDRWIAFRALMSYHPAIAPTLTYISKNYPRFAKALGSRVYSVFYRAAYTITQQSDIDMVNRMMNDPSLDSGLKDMLNYIVLPGIARHQAFVSSAPATDLKSWVDTYISSSAASLIVNFLLVLAAAVVVFANISSRQV